MKQATCRELKGACDFIITGNTPEEMAENSRKHAMEMVAKGDQAHIDAMEEMKNMKPKKQKEWYRNFVKDFDSLKDV